MRSYNLNTDRIMMPSTFRWDARNTTDEREAGIMKYAPLVMKVVNKFDRDEARIHVFDKHDLIQSGFVGLIEGYDRLKDLDVEDQEKNDINYLMKNIEGTINRYLNYQASGVAIPEYQIQKSKAEMFADAVFGAWMYSFKLDDLNPNSIRDSFADHLQDDFGDDSYDNELLNEHLTTMLYQLPERERNILSYSYGIGYNKHSIKEIAIRLNLSEIRVKQIKKIALVKLNTEKNKGFIENFL